MRYARWLEILLGLVFIGAVIPKALDLPSFAVQIRFYGVIDKMLLLRMAACCTIVVETGLGIALLAGTRRQGLVLGATCVMLVGFTGLIWYAWVYNGLEDCGCFGSAIPMPPGRSIVKNLVMLAVAAAIWWLRRKPEGEEVKPARWGNAQTGIAACSVALVLAATAFGENKGFFKRPDVDEQRPFAQFQFDFEGEHWDLGQGEYLVALLSTDCEHCQAAAEALNEVVYVGGLPQVIGLMWGEDEAEHEDYRMLTDAEFPSILIDTLVFFDFVPKDTEPPRFFYIRDGRAVRVLDVEEPTTDGLLEFLLAEDDAPE
jgi:uncharacterized membrane protein YphA (DoxX/SURF4 family)